MSLQVLKNLIYTKIKSVSGRPRNSPIKKTKVRLGLGEKSLSWERERERKREKWKYMEVVQWKEKKTKLQRKRVYVCVWMNELKTHFLGYFSIPLHTLHSYYLPKLIYSNQFKYFVLVEFFKKWSRIKMALNLKMD